MKSSKMREVTYNHQLDVEDEEAAQKRTRILVFSSSLLVFIASLNKQNYFFIAFFVSALFFSFFLKEKIRLWLQSSTGWSAWPMMLIVGFSLTQMTPDGAKQFYSLAAWMILLANWRIVKNKDVVAAIPPYCCLASFGFIYSESLQTALLIFLSTFLLVIALSCAKEKGRRKSLFFHGWKISKLLVFSLPGIIILFLAFPRMPFVSESSEMQDTRSGSTGLSDAMSPGSISELVKKNDPVLSAKFEKSIANEKNLYWKSNVFDYFDGIKWSSSSILLPKQLESMTSKIENSDKRNSYYQVSLTGLTSKFIPVLDETAKNSILLKSNNTSKIQINSNEWGVFHLSSPGLISESYEAFLRDDGLALDEVANLSRMKKFLQIPKDKMPLTRKMAQTALKNGTNVRSLIDFFRMEINQKNFWYTLKPGLLKNDSVDEFLFESQKGFCEHYASAFVMFMRSAGIPARVVTGYQGGERVSSTGEVHVSSRDAHAWSEVLSDGRWMRVDPTSFIDPSRIDPDTLNDQSYSWGALNQWNRAFKAWGLKIEAHWSEKFVSFDADTQESLIRKLGIQPRWRHVFTFLCVVTVGFSFWIVLFFKSNGSFFYKKKSEIDRIRSTLNGYGIHLIGKKTLMDARQEVEALTNAGLIKEKKSFDIIESINKIHSNRYKR